MRDAVIQLGDDDGVLPQRERDDRFLSPMDWLGSSIDPQSRGHKRRSIRIDLLAHEFRVPVEMIADSCHLSSLVLGKNQLCTINLEKKTRFRFRIDLEFAPSHVFAFRFANQVISFAADPQFEATRRNGVWREFVLTDARDQKFCIHLDRKTWFWQLWRFRRNIGNPAVAIRSAAIIDHQCGYLAASISRKRKRRGAQPFEKSSLRFG